MPNFTTSEIPERSYTVDGAQAGMNKKIKHSNDNQLKWNPWLADVMSNHPYKWQVLYSPL